MNEIDKLGKSIQDNINIEELSLKDIYELFDKDSKEIKHFEYEIKNKGLKSFHLSIKKGLSKKTKQKIVRNTVKNWNNNYNPTMIVRL